MEEKDKHNIAQHHPTSPETSTEKKEKVRIM